MNTDKTYSKISVKTINGNRFTVTTENGFTGVSETMDVSTNKNGEGLWINGTQSLGTSQFSTGKNAGQSIRRYFARQ